MSKPFPLYSHLQNPVNSTLSTPVTASYPANGSSIRPSGLDSRPRRKKGTGSDIGRWRGRGEDRVEKPCRVRLVRLRMCRVQKRQRAKRSSFTFTAVSNLRTSCRSMADLCCTGAYYVGQAATHRLITIALSKACNARVFGTQVCLVAHLQPSDEVLQP